MKLFGWMHRKFRQNSSDAGRDLAIVSACLYCLSGKHSVDDRRPDPPPEIFRQYFLPVETEPPELTSSILFNGLLHIGTFGSPLVITEIEPPVAEEIAEKEIEMTTESEMIAISVELEKAIAAESEKEKNSGDRFSSATERHSHAGSTANVSDVCPLQDFLFGSTVEGVAKRRRGSLGELFMRSRAAEGGGSGERREGMMLDYEGVVKPAPPPEEMRRMLKCRGSVSGGGAADGKYGGGVSKIQNILRIFQRKIHPENSIATKKHTKPVKCDANRDVKCRTKNKGSWNSSKDNGMQVLSSRKVDEKKSFSIFKESKAFVKNNSTGNHEQWIKTDADYVVLELQELETI